MSTPSQLRLGNVVTVSPFGGPGGTAPRGRSGLPNDGADFGPDTPGTTTGGFMEAEEALRSGGGIVQLAPGAPIAIRSAVTFYSGVHVFGNGATLLNAAKGPTPFRTDPSTVFFRTEIRGPLVLDQNFAPKGVALTVTSAQRSRFDVSIENFNGSVGLEMTVNDAVPKSLDGNWGGQNRNNRVWVEGHKGTTLVRIAGTEGCAVTLNDFFVVSGNMMGMDGSRVRLIDFVQNCDNNLVYDASLSTHASAAAGSCVFHFNSVGGASKVRRNRIYKSTLDNNAPATNTRVAIFGGQTALNELLGMQYGVNPPNPVIEATPTDVFNAVDLMTNGRWVAGRPVPGSGGAAVY
ncbi:MAG TPA: hypothetical protein VFF67_03215 [Thermoplasmata archaeon]|nr:hypothetical protein [Thermoplasmata archaeon]